MRGLFSHCGKNSLKKQPLSTRCCRPLSQSAVATTAVCHRDSHPLCTYARLICLHGLSVFPSAQPSIGGFLLTALGPLGNRYHWWPSRSSGLEPLAWRTEMNTGWPRTEHQKGFHLARNGIRSLSGSGVLPHTPNLGIFFYRMVIIACTCHACWWSWK